MNKPSNTTSCVVVLDGLFIPYSYYLGTLNGLKDVKCRRACRDCGKRFLNAAIPTDHEITLCLN
jgi:hypothetical protein